MNVTASQPSRTYSDMSLHIKRILPLLDSGFQFMVKINCLHSLRALFLYLYSYVIQFDPYHLLFGQLYIISTTFSDE